MNEHSFLRLVKKKGSYRSEGEAARAVNSVFGTIKALLSPAASDVIRKVLPQDASQLWRFSPACFSSDHRADQHLALIQPRHFLLRIQQLGEYHSFPEATRAATAVVAALTRSLPHSSGRFLKRMVPAEIAEASRLNRDRAA